MTRDRRFWRNVTIVGLIHVVVLLGLVWWAYAPRRSPKEVIWLEGGANAGALASANRPAATPEVPPESTPQATVELPTPEVMPTAKSEIQMPSTISPTPTPQLTPTPEPTSTPEPTHTPKPTPKPTPQKVKPPPTPKKKKTTPKPKPTPNEKKEVTTETTNDASEKEKSGENEKASSKKPIKKAAAATSSGEGETKNPKGSGGSGGTGKGAGPASEFGWYANMLHDRFYSEWVQPTSVVHSAKLTVLLRIRIEKDGRISNYEIAKSSGNPVVDDSVTAAAARVKQVDPLPAGLGDDYYDVQINFELE
jgi:TonB family protein